MSGRGTRPSSLGSNSRKFEEVRTPDGQTFEVVRSRSAATLICLTENGGWPDRALTMLDYDVAHATAGALLEIEEGRPGHGLGTLTGVRVIESHTRIKVQTGRYGQLQRWVLAEVVVAGDAIGDLSTLDDLRGTP